MSKKIKSASSTRPKLHPVRAARVNIGSVMPFSPRVHRRNGTRRERPEQGLQQLTGRLIAAQEEERKRIARELHDDLNQRIAVISIELEQLRSLAAPLKSMVDEHISRIQKHIEEIGYEIHVISHQLHPSKLDHLGLVPAIRGLCKESSNGRGFEIRFSSDDLPTQLHKDLKLCMFRVAQEAIRNAAKHSGATNVIVELSSIGDAVRLLVTDNGSGFAATPETIMNGLGLTSMEERLRLIDGELFIRSRPGNGTVIEAIAPLTPIRSYDN